MNTNRLFDFILRIYPRAFRTRFGDELRTLHEHSASATRLETLKFMGDLLGGAIYERLRVWTWLRFAAALLLTSWLAISVMYVTWTQATTAMFLTVLPGLMIVSDLGVLTLLLALLSRLPRAPILLEWSPMLWGVLSVVVYLVTLPFEASHAAISVRAAVGWLALPLSLMLYGSTCVRSVGVWSRVLGACLIGFGALAIATSFSSSIDFVFGIEKYRVWGAMRGVLVSGIILGLIFDGQSTRKPYAPSHQRVR
jgi:hypothetical protein